MEREGRCGKEEEREETPRLIRTLGVLVARVTVSVRGRMVTTVSVSRIRGEWRRLMRADARAFAPVGVERRASRTGATAAGRAAPWTNIDISDTLIYSTECGATRGY